MRHLVGALLCLAMATPPVPVVQERPDITYATVAGTDLKLDLYLPTTAGAHPVVVYLTGGAWMIGSRKGYPVPLPWGHITTVAHELAQRGYAVASVDYRLSDKAQWPAQIHDVKAAVRWLRANASTYGLDPNRFAAWGDSAGGHLSAMLGVSGGVPELEGDEGNPGYSSRVQAVADWFGPADLTTMQAQTIPFGQSHDGETAPEAKLLGCAIPACPEKARAASPVSYVSADSPPFLFQHGELDHLVPYGQSVELRDALNRAGVPTEFHGYPLTDHEFVGLVPPPVLTRTLFAFLDAHLLS